MLLILALFAIFILIGLSFNFISLSLGFGVFALFIALLVTSYRLVYGLGLIAFAIALSPEIMIAGLPLRIEDFLIPLVFIVWFAQNTLHKRPLKPTRLWLPIMAFLFFMAVATLNSFIIEVGAYNTRAVFHFLKHVEYLLIFFLALNIVKDKADIKFVVYCSIFAACTVAIFTVYIQPTVRETPHQEKDITSAVQQNVPEPTGRSKPRRVRGVKGETANIFGGYLVFHFMIALSLALVEESFRRKLLLFIAVAIIFIPIMFTYSRSSYVAFTVGLLFIGGAYDKRVIFALLFIPLFGTLLFPEALVDRFMTIYDTFITGDLDPSWQARLNAWKKYVPVIIKNPLIGKGLFYIPPAEVDNDFVLRAVETGILGLLSFLWLLGAFARRSWFLFKEGMETFELQLGLGYTTGLIALLFHSLAAPSFTTIRIAEPVYLFAGLTLSLFLIHFKITGEHSIYALSEKVKERRLKMSVEKHRLPSLGKHNQ